MIFKNIPSNSKIMPVSPLLPGLPAEYCACLAHTSFVAYYVNVCSEFPFFLFYSSSSGITVISKGVKYNYYIIYLENFLSWPDPLSSFTVSLSSASLLLGRTQMQVSWDDKLKKP